MMNLRTFLGSMIFIIGVMVITVSPALAEVMTAKTTFEPVYVGHKQRNIVMVVNKSDGFNFNDIRTIGDNKYQINRVVVRAFNPFTGELIDEQMLDEDEIVEPGMGVSWVPTITIPQAHPSLVVVLVEFEHSIGDAVSGGSLEIEGNDDEELPFIVTSLLVTRRQHNTILQVKGVTELLNNGSSTPVE